MADKIPRKPRGRKPAGRPAPEPDIEAAAGAGIDAALGERPPESDTPPGGSRTRPRRRISKKVTQQIEDALAELLTMPAVPCAIAGDAWAADHFTTAGREFANKIAVVSERHDVLRRWCERALEGESVAVLLVAGLAYALPPMIHWNIIPGPAGMMGVPRVPRRRRPEPEQSSSGSTEWPEDRPDRESEPAEPEVTFSETGPPTYQEAA